MSPKLFGSLALWLCSWQPATGNRQPGLPNGPNLIALPAAIAAVDQNIHNHR
jgi:hypothetical protein